MKNALKISHILFFFISLNLFAAGSKTQKPLKYGKLQVRFTPGSLLTKTAKPLNLPINSEENPVLFETELFKGQVVIRVKDAEAEPSEYFSAKGRTEKYSIQIEGYFKKELPGNEVLFGAAFDKELKPPYFFPLSFMMRVVKGFVPNLHYSLESSPWFMESLLTSTDTLFIKNEIKKFPAEMEPCVEESKQITPANIPTRSGKKAERRKYFSKEENRQQVRFETKKLYSFNFISSFLDLNTFYFNLGAIRKDIAPYLNEQPLRFESKWVGSQGENKGLLWSIEFIHDDSF